MFDYIGSLVLRFQRIAFFQAKFQISLSLSNIRMAARTFKFIYHIASFQMCLLVLVLLSYRLSVPAMYFSTESTLPFEMSGMCLK